MSAPLLAVERVCRRFGNFRAVNDVSFTLESGGVTAIIGPNGAGKSTLFNMLSGSLRPTSGRVIVEGRDVTGMAPHRFAHFGIAKSFQITNVFPSLSVLENVRIAVQARFGRLDPWTPRTRTPEYVRRAHEVLAMLGLSDRADSRATALSHGQQRALEIAIALAADPRLLLLDEPTAGMSPEESVGMMNLIRTLAAQRTVVLVEHKMKLVMEISRRILVLHHGELLADGSADEIRAHPDVQSVYLGRGRA